MRSFVLIISALVLSIISTAASAEFITGPGFAAASIGNVDEMKKIAEVRSLQKDDDAGIKKAVSILKDGSETPFIRVEAARVLGRVGGTEALDALKEMADETGNNIPAEIDPDKVVDANGEVGAAAVVAIQKWRFGGNIQDMRDAVYTLINFPSRAVRVEAALALAELGDERALPLLDEPGLLEAHEKLALLLEMRGLASDDKITKLVTIIKTPASGATDVARKEAAVSILSDMGSPAFSVVTGELDGLSKGQLSEDKAEIYRYFSSAAIMAGNKDAIPALEKFATSKDTMISTMAKNAVKLLNDGIPAVKHGPDFDGRGLL